MRHKEINVSDVKRYLNRYCENPPADSFLQQMIECYKELSPESQDEIATIIHRIVLKMRNGAGVLNALEIIGALLKAGAL